MYQKEWFMMNEKPHACIIISTREPADEPHVRELQQRGDPI